MNRHVGPKSLRPAAWSVAEAKARFSEVVARAKAGEPQHVTRYGKDEVVVVSAADWRASQNVSQAAAEDPNDRPGSLFDVFAPLIGSGIVFERMSGGLRPVFGDDD